MVSKIKHTAITATGHTVEEKMDTVKRRLSVFVKGNPNTGTFTSATVDVYFGSESGKFVKSSLSLAVPAGTAGVAGTIDIDFEIVCFDVSALSVIGDATLDIYAIAHE